jgi:hypothetical protein
MRRITTMVAMLIAALLIAGPVGCSAKKPAAPSVVGSWQIAESAGDAGKLFDLTLAQDGTFIYAGKNALGAPVRFLGTYTMGKSADGEWLRLSYNDRPGDPTVWFYRVDDKQLAVSTQPGNLDNGTALVFIRK